MKLNKKFLSCFMAATMMVSPAAVFADTVDVASGTVNGTGTVHYVNTKVYNIILPTDEALDFSIDPMGLLSINGTVDLATALSNAAAAPTNVTSKATAIINKSSVPVTVNVETSIHNGNSSYSIDTDVSAAAVNLVTTKTAVEVSNSDVSHAAMYLAVTPLSGAFFTAGSIATGPASKVADLTMDATNVTNKTITGAVYTLSEASIDLSNVEALDDEVVTANGATATPDSFKINLSGMPEAYNVSSASSIALLDESKADAILSNAASAAAVSYIFNITGKVDIDSDVWKQFSDDQYSWPGQQEIGLKVKFNITSAAEEIKEAYAVKSGTTYWVGTVADATVGFTGTPTILINGAAPASSSDVTITASNQLTLKETTVAWYKSTSGSCKLTITDNNGTYTVTL